MDIEKKPHEAGMAVPLSSPQLASCLASLIRTPRQLHLEKVLTLPLGFRQMELAEHEGNLTAC